MDMKDFLAKEIEYPFVMAASTGDGLIPWKYQREIYEKIKVKDNNKSFLLLDLPRTHMSLHERPKECAAKIIPAIERLFKC
jgi:adenylate kinase family enzyme